MEDVGSLYESALVNIHAHVSSLLNESSISPETIPDLSAIFSLDGVHGSLFSGSWDPWKAATILYISFAICGKWSSVRVDWAQIMCIVSFIYRSPNKFFWECIWNQKGEVQSEDW